MTIQINNANHIILDTKPTKLRVAQFSNGTVVYLAENLSGYPYQEFEMPRQRYSLAHTNPASGNPGSIVFEQDFRALLACIQAKDIEFYKFLTNL